MTRVVIAGTVLALAAGLIVLLSPTLGPEVQGVALLGAALGGALGLVPDRHPAARACAFGVGLVAAAVGYLARAALLPDAPSGRAVAVIGVVLLCVAVAAGTRRRLPLWAHLLGAGALTGAFEATYTADPSGITTTIPVAATAVLLSAAVGFLTTALLAPAARTDLADDDLSAGERAELAERRARAAERTDAAAPPAPQAPPGAAPAAGGVATFLPPTTREA